ncbi:MAG: hypothetical protein DRI48_11610 [Chloroflexi bacterium]|nr:MAG: hypothetical protein DRI48_11610 [Chloroflexota bacterium]
MDEEKLTTLLEEATAHCYDEEDEFWAVFSALVGRVSYPLQVSVAGEAATLVGVDGSTSSPETGITARIEKGGEEEPVPLADVEVVDADSESAAWLAMYRYWREKGG